MLASFLLSLREGLEAALIIGIVLAALKKFNRNELSSAVWRGVIAAVGISILVALGLNWMGARLEGRAEEIFEGSAMWAAAILLTWMIIWMRRQSATLQKELEHGVAEASAGKNQKSALFWLSLLAVGREGFELVLFLTAIQFASDGFQTLTGAVLGLAASIALGWAFFASSKRMSLRTFFNFTNVLLVLIAAGLLAHGVHEFNEAGIIPPVVENIWNVNPILSDKAPVGQLLTALFGYNGNPSLTEMIAYVGFLLGVGLMWKRWERPAPVRQAG